MGDFKLTWRLSPLLWLVDEKWEAFLRLIDRHADVADEIAFFLSDDMYTDGTPYDDRRRQAEIVARRIADIRARGRTAGINVWPSFDLYGLEQIHFDHFPRMVNADGSLVKAIACPISEEFLSYTREKYRIYASARPDFIWVDDDCRFTHLSSGSHYPCFCQKCVRGFQNGAWEDRETLVAALNAPENEELRLAWSDYGADRLAAFCAAARAAVDEIDPDIDTPFMTVGATHTTFAGDYIDKCMRALRSRRGRPGHGHYTDIKPDDLQWKAMEVGRQTAEYPDHVTDIFWEEDSHPQTCLNKSFFTRRCEIGMAIMAGCSGIAFNHQSGNPDVDRMLSREVDELHAMRPLWEKFYAAAKDLPWRGLWPVHSWHMCARMDCKNGWFNEEKNLPYDITRPEALGPSGMALTSQKSGACATLLTGETLRAFGREELIDIFRGNVMLDAGALEALTEMGLSHLAGVECDGPTGGCCYLAEHEFCGPFAGWFHVTLNPKIPLRRLRAVCDGVEFLAHIRGFADGEGIPCLAKFTNELGGRVIADGYDPWKYRDDPHQLYLLSSIARWFGAPATISYADPVQTSRLQPFVRTDGERAAVIVLNAGLDESYPCELRLSGSMTEAVILTPDGDEIPLISRREEDALCVSLPPIGRRDMAYILAK